MTRPIDPDLDARLSAWIDGELPEAEARALAERIAREPALAARVAALSDVDARLRALPATPASDALRSRLAARLRGEEGVGAGAVVALPHRTRGMRRAFSAAAALAAGIALYVALRSTPPVAPGSDSEPRVAELPAPGPAPGADPAAGSTPALDADEAELALALDYELLRDFDAIDQLEVLEVLAAYEDAEAGRS